MISVAIIFENFGPYHVARLEAAAREYHLLAVEVAGKSEIYAWKNDPNAGDFQRVTLIQEATSRSVAGAELRRRMAQALEEFRPGAVVVPGWATPVAWLAMDWCVRNGVPMVCLSESTAQDEPRAAWKDWIKRKLIRTFSSALVGGRRHRDYLAALGLPGSQVFFGYDAVDNGYFATRVAAVRAQAHETRLRLGLPQDYFLSSARFVGKKNLSRLLDSYAQYRLRQAAPWSLVLLGDGDLRADLERQVDALGLRESVRMPGFVQYDGLPDYYALAGAFIHPSTVEPWGLVVNEAMASGLPVLVSNLCGCVPELVHDGVNGFTFDPLDADDLAQKMAQVAMSGFPRADYGRKSREIVAQWGPDRFAQGLSLAIGEALARGPIPIDATTRALLWMLNRQ